MKKRILALILAAVLVAAVIPAVFADDPIDITNGCTMTFTSSNGDIGSLSDTMYVSEDGVYAFQVSTPIPEGETVSVLELNTDNEHFTTLTKKWDSSTNTLYVELQKGKTYAWNHDGSENARTYTITISRVDKMPDPSAGPSPSTPVDPSPAPSTSVDPSPSPSASAAPSPTPSASAAPSPSPSASANPSPTPSTSVDPIPSPSASVEPSPEPSDPVEPSPYADVATNAWYYEAVKYVTDKKLMNGISDGVFAPDSQLTRAQLVMTLWRLEGTPSAAAATFTDVKAGDWFAKAIAWAAANKIVNGYDANTFAPDDDITREQTAAILYRYAQYTKLDVSVAGDLSGYTDMGSVDGYAVDAMKWANGTGLLTGETVTTLVPRGTATRAQIATILMRYCENVAK